MTARRFTATGTGSAARSAGAARSASKPAGAVPYLDRVRALSEASVRKHHRAFTDVAWDDAAMRIDPGDPRWALPAHDVLGATAWYRALPAEVRSELGLYRTVVRMKTGVVFENLLKRGMLEFAATRGNRSPEARYALHEIIEEAEHSLMFQEFIDRSGFDPAALAGASLHLARAAAACGRHFPALFFLFVLGGEAPIDHDQRVQLQDTPDLHPLMRRIDEIHVCEEARHLAFARAYLREHVPRLPWQRRALLSIVTPLVFHAMTRLIITPPSSVVRRFAIPRHVVDEAYARNPRQRELVRAAFAPVVELCREVGLVTPWTRPLWSALGL